MCALCFIHVAVDIKWLGIHYGDLFDESNQPKVPRSSIQSWTSADQQIHTGLVPIVLKYIVSSHVHILRAPSYIYMKLF